MKGPKFKKSMAPFGRCTECRYELPPLNGSEENDFRTVCEECAAADDADREMFDDDVSDLGDIGNK